MKPVGYILLFVFFLLLLGQTPPCSAQKVKCFEWRMELNEPGLTTQVVRSQFAQGATRSLELHFKSCREISDFIGLELILKAEPAAAIEIELHALVDTSASDELTEATLNTVVSTIGSEIKHLFIPFDRFEIEEISKGKLQLSSIKIIRPKGLFFIPRAPTTLEIRRVAFYNDTKAELKRFIVDGFSYESSLEVFKHVIWFAYSETPTGYEGNYVRPSPLHPVPWVWFHSQGGTLDVIPDPTGSGRGLVCRATIPPMRGEDGVLLANSGPKRELWPRINVYRVYGFVDFEFQPAPCEISIDVWASKKLVETAVRATGGVVLLDVYDKSWRFDPVGHSSLQAKLWVGSMEDNGEGPFLDLKTGDDAHSVAPRMPQAPIFTPEEWHTIKIVITADRIAELYLDGVLAAKGPLAVYSRCGTTGGHPGLYVHDRRGPYSVRGTLLIDNYVINCCGSTDGQ